MTEIVGLAEACARLSAAIGGGAAADLASACMIEAEMLGQPHFGLDFLSELGGSRPLSPQDSDAAVVWTDHGGSFGMLAVADAVLALPARARRHGIAASFLRGVRGFGRLAPLVRHLADQGLVAIAGAEGPPYVTPDGGAAPVIGTNPVALAMGRGDAQIVIDMATASATMAHVRAARAGGTRLSEGIAIDREGRPTVIPEKVAALLPRGGRVGSLLGLVIELLAGIAGQARGEGAGRGVFFIAIDAASEQREADWHQRLARLKEDWAEGGGHWPSGGSASGDGPLPATVAGRLRTALDRLLRETT